MIAETFGGKWRSKQEARKHATSRVTTREQLAHHMDCL